MSYDVFNEINKMPILDVCNTLGVEVRKNGSGYVLAHPDGRKDTSFSFSVKDNIVNDFGKTGIKGGVFDFIGRYHLNIDEQDLRSSTGRAAVVKFCVEKNLITPPENTFERKKAMSHDQLLSDFDSLRLGGYKAEISGLLITRGVPYDWVQKHHIIIGEVFKDIGYYDNYFCNEFESHQDEDGEWVYTSGDTPKNVAVFLFPCYDIVDGVKTLIGLKLRRKDGKTIRGKKSYAIGKTGLLWTDINTTTSYIVEGEMDWVILKILGYKGVIGNLGGVKSHRDKLRSLTHDVGKVVCLYDDDIAGQTAKKELAGSFGRSIHEIVFPIREDSRGVALSDVNDFYKAGYDTKAKWDKILAETKVVGEEQDKNSRFDFIFLRKHMEYYDTKYKRKQSSDAIAGYLGLTKKELYNLISQKVIHEYEDLCYFYGGRKGHYNILDETTIMLSGGDAQPEIHPHIDMLINNIAGNKVKNAQWIHKSILYKLTHLNDVHMPALVLYGSGGSGKGTFLNLLSKIFGSDNTLIGLGQKDLESDFDTYKGGKLIVEFKEVSSGNTAKDKKILDRMKSFIGEDKITVNAKHENVKEVDNIARFHLSSNHAVPLQMDSKHSGNRRFTVIKTGGRLDPVIAKKMNDETFTDRANTRKYVNWLFKTFPEVPEMTTLPALDNAEKDMLENQCEGAGNQFFEWFEDKYPHKSKITNVEKNKLLQAYCLENGEDIGDPKFRQNNFDLSLSHRYEKKTIKVRDKSAKGYYIRKTKLEKLHMPEGEKDHFDNGDLDNLLIGIT